MEEIVEKIREIADSVFKGIEKVDKVLKIVKSLSESSLQEVKNYFMTTLVELDKMSLTSFENAIKETLKYIFMSYKKYINLDTFVKKIGVFKNVNLISIFDCCREKKLKGGDLTKEEKEKLNK